MSVPTLKVVVRCDLGGDLIARDGRGLHPGGARRERDIVFKFVDARVTVRGIVMSGS